MRRRRATAELVPLPEQVKAAPVFAPGRPVVEQVERGLLEARAIGFAFQRLGPLAPPALAWRCTRLGETIIGAITETFGDEIL